MTVLPVDRTPPAAHTRILEGCAVARAITRANARNFYYGLRLTPEPKRSAIYAIYAWMREADDIVDSRRPDAPATLAAFAARTRAMLDGDLMEDGYWPALAWAVRTFPIRERWLADLLNGVAGDLRAPRMQSWAEVLWYCDCVGSTAGLCSVAIWGLREPDAAGEAESLITARGRAFQLINILRDVRTDWADFRRIYLPQELLAAHGLEIGSLLAWSDAAACTAVIADVAARARSLLVQAAPLDRLIHRDGAAAMSVMTRIYTGILDRIERHPHRAVAPERVRVPTAAKLAIVGDAVVRSWLR